MAQKQPSVEDGGQEYAFLRSWYYHVHTATFLVDKDCTSKQELLPMLVSAMLCNQGIPAHLHGPTIGTVLYREWQATTGVGKGVAVPEGLSLAWEDSLVGWCLTSQPVDWDSLDRKPVTLVSCTLFHPQWQKKLLRSTQDVLEVAFSLIQTNASRQAAMRCRTAEELRNLVSAHVLSMFGRREADVEANLGRYLELHRGALGP